MSSYLLLRNNKESGPFTMDEIKGMPLKAYDLLWIVGKSAAWRYPGEIPEFMSFAPAIPAEPEDIHLKKPVNDIPVADSNIKKQDPINTRPREGNNQRINTGRSEYVNMPAEKKITTASSGRSFQEAAFIPTNFQDPAYDFSDLYKKHPGKTVRQSGQILWISTIILLFGAGILTGLFISDRRKFFTADANRPQKNPVDQPMVLSNKKEISPVILNSGKENINNSLSAAKDSVKELNPTAKKIQTGTGKKNLKNQAAKKDSITNLASILSNFKLDDSIKQNNVSKTESLFQKIAAHPENYVNLVTGRYSTGLFGGISSFPVTVTNNSSFVMDLVVVNIDYVQNNEKVFKSESLSFNALEPGETVTMKAPKSSRGVKIVTHIHVVNPRQVDLSSTH
ncbi:MAG: hypothetical protein M3N30_06415 [Bacteroidota bacterium]|nr:hypothetical protein [Bacteroidota bacterium]